MHLSFKLLSFSLIMQRLLRKLFWLLKTIWNWIKISWTGILLKGEYLSKIIKTKSKFFFCFFPSTDDMIYWTAHVRSETEDFNKKRNCRIMCYKVFRRKRKILINSRNTIRFYDWKGDLIIKKQNKNKLRLGNITGT